MRISTRIWLPLAAKGLAVIPVAADAETDEGIAADDGGREETPRARCMAWSMSPAARPRHLDACDPRHPRADWRALFSQNLETMFFMSQAVAAELRASAAAGLDRLAVLDQRHEHRALSRRLRRARKPPSSP